MEKIKRDRYATKLQNFFSGGLTAVVLVFMQSFSGSDVVKLDPPASIEITAFAIALPLLGGTFMLGVVEHKFKYGPRSRLSNLTHACYIAGIGMAMVGIAAALWHILFVAGIAFMAITAFVLVVYGLYILELEEKPRNEVVRVRKEVAVDTAPLPPQTVGGGE
jgi:hypothetical protein